MLFKYQVKAYLLICALRLFSVCPINKGTYAYILQLEPIVNLHAIANTLKSIDPGPVEDVEVIETYISGTYCDVKFTAVLGSEQDLSTLQNYINSHGEPSTSLAIIFHQANIELESVRWIQQPLSVIINIMSSDEDWRKKLIDNFEKVFVELEEVCYHVSILISSIVSIAHVAL